MAVPTPVCDPFRDIGHEYSDSLEEAWPCLGRQDDVGTRDPVKRGRDGITPAAAYPGARAGSRSSRGVRYRRTAWAGAATAAHPARRARAQRPGTAGGDDDAEAGGLSAVEAVLPEAKQRPQAEETVARRAASARAYMKPELIPWGRDEMGPEIWFYRDLRRQIYARILEQGKFTSDDDSDEKLVKTYGCSSDGDDKILMFCVAPRTGRVVRKVENVYY